MIFYMLIIGEENHFILRDAQLFFINQVVFVCPNFRAATFIWQKISNEFGWQK